MEHDSNRFKEIFRKSVGKLPDIISSIDHVFGSPPLRLLDGHNKLLNKNALILIHDLTVPDIHRYRIDFVLDSGLFNSQNPIFHLFKANTPSCLSPINIPDFSAQKSYLKIALNSINSFSIEQKDVYLKRFDILTHLYEDSIKKSNNTGEFYKNLMLGLYSLIALYEQEKFINNSMVSIYNSGLLKKYLPQCIRLTKNTSLGINSLIKTNIFSNALFKNSIDQSNLNLNSYEDEEFVCNLEKGFIFPSYEILLWSFALAEIKHFGNDYGFFQRLSDNLNTNSILELQITKSKEDGENFVTFTDSVSYSIEERNAKFKLQKNYPKISRINNLCVAYLHYGDYLKEYWLSFINNHKKNNLSMNEILI